MFYSQLGFPTKCINWVGYTILAVYYLPQLMVYCLSKKIRHSPFSENLHLILNISEITISTCLWNHYIAEKDNTNWALIK